ncbi:branched-chain amino acid ABC transporter ATP-binding protein/permease [Bradyrhizobium prioriisuperbiae]|uniref:branched-chain amino acid ABC transporter ATP-binding protein/permease n=1 Tax=Bradyrhizobium prioriisuperbiae TaxID=2854389 RepID=UPI0028EC8CD0|nr:branched-chain amino acid ABC transporter ATP-binding protein/permease [Bradyrhizobium prioritasuperba]
MSDAPGIAAELPATDGAASLRDLLPRLLPFVAIFAVALVVPFLTNDYWVLIASRAAIYWVLIAALNLVVGFAGQLAIGYIALLTLGAYTTSVLAAGNVLPPIPSFAALGIAGVAGAIFGVVVGLPALRLRTFYFAISTLGFATIVTQIALAWQSVTGGGIGLSGPQFPGPFESTHGFYYLCLALAALITWMTANVAHSRVGRALVTIRDADVAAEASGISKPRLLISIFMFSGAVAAIAGGLFASLQTYITPDAFTFDLSVMFFIAILIGGRGSILGPLIGTIVLTLLPEFVASLAAWSTFLYAVLLLGVVLVAPGGIAALLDMRNRTPLQSNRAITPRVALLDDMLGTTTGESQISLERIELRFASVRAIDGVDLVIRSGRVHGLIGPNGSGKTTILNVISGYYRPQVGRLMLGNTELETGAPVLRAARGIARTFQTPRIVGESSVLDNVLIGATIRGTASFPEILFALGRHRRDESALRSAGRLALRVVGLESLADVRADRLQHSELRFLEIARALMLRPQFLLLDEPAAGLSADEIRKLGQLIKAISRCGVGVLLVEHHADLIFDICDDVTVLNLGKVLARGTPSEIRVHKDVVHAYLGG